MWLRAAIVVGSFAVSTWASAPVGIPRELAAERAAAISNLRYKVSFELGANHKETAPGTAELRFDLSKDGPLLLDYRGDHPWALVVNGRASGVVAENGHILLSGSLLHRGENVVSLHFDAPIGAAGKAITRYEDKEDGSEYFYSLFVPMDASAAFPCFDQPDLKGRFTLTLFVPSGYTVVGNTEVNGMIGSFGTTNIFSETQPISTYLFAFATGPFERVHPTPGLPNVYVRRSQLARAQSEIPTVQQVTADGIHFFSKYFGQPFPFPKYDMVLIPGFPFGGMEHAGATFLNEDSVLFRSVPTEDDRFGRNTRLLHELAHQWFGDLTTMKWFDDLWLKEGFAQYMAYRALAELKPEQNVWAHFYQQIKPAAYGIDVTRGTTPIYQDIANLKDAKSAYGAIVYSKAPALLKQLAFLIGDEHFRDGLRIYLREHLYASAQWSDLVSAFERSSGQNLKPWATAWITRRAMPEITTHWECLQGRLTKLALTQKSVLADAETWPLATQVLLAYESAPPIRLRANLTGQTALVTLDQACPAYVFANDEDNAYGLFLLDDKSRAYIAHHIGTVSDVLERTLLWGALWDSVRAAEMAPAEYLETALRELPKETNETLVRSIGSRSAVALHDYSSDAALQKWAPQFESLAATNMMHAPDKGLRILWFRTLLSLATTEAALHPVRQLLSGDITIPGVELRSLDRWRMVGVLIAQRWPDADALFAAESKRDATGIGPKYAYVAEAAKQDVATKRKYFDDYLHNAARQEDWVQSSLDNFNSWNASALTAPYLRPALDALPQIKQQRKIFFTLAWLNAFIGGQHSAESAKVVHDWLATANTDEDLKLKVLQVVDDLDRAVRIRARFP